MANSYLTITINALPSANQGLSITDTLLSIPLLEIFQTERTAFTESTIGNSLDECAHYLGKSLNQDYNNTLLYKITVLNNVVTITALNESSQFSEAQNTTSGIVINVVNGTPEETFTIDNIAISEADVNPCNSFKVSITTNNQANNVLSPVSQSVSTNPIEIDLPRDNNSTTITIERNGLEATEKLRVPLLLPSYFRLNILSTPSGGSINAEKLTPLTLSNELVIEYSLDNTIWQSSGYFNNLSNGNFTLYIRDNIGCNVTKSFTIDEFVPNLLDFDGIAEISNLNSIRFKDDVVWSETLKKTPWNTLSFEEDVKLPNKTFLQLFEKRDTITTQIKTNYTNITAKIIDNQGNETNLVVEKKTANMNITDIREAVVESVVYNTTEYTGLRFSGGKIFSPETLAEIGNYNIGLNVPEWINKDDFLNIQGVGWYKVLDIIFSNNAYVVVLNLLLRDFPFTNPSTQKITSVYNALDYEIYEFDIDFSNYEGFFKVQVNVSDDNFISKQFLSEWLHIKENHSKAAIIQSYNTENNEINFATGIKALMRIGLSDDLVWKPNTEIDIYVTDTNTENLESKYRGFWDISSKLLPIIIAEKLVLMLLQDRLFINGESYKTEGEIETIKIGSQYQVKASLVKSNHVFELYSGKGEITLPNDKTLLQINSGGGFLQVE